MEDYSVGERNIELRKKLCERDFEKREFLKDEKVLLKQKAWFEEEVKFQEMKRKVCEEKTEEEKKRKRQLSLGNKKKKAKSKKEKQKVEKSISDDSLNHINNINEKLDPLFEEVGLKRNEHRVYKVKADGACASNCVAAHCHGDSKLGTYVRQNLNEYMKYV